MPVDLQVANFEGVWRGLMDRKRAVDHPELYASDARNVELLGNVISKRLGVKRLNDLSWPYGTPSNHRIYALFYVRWRHGSGVPDSLLVAAGSLIQKQGDPPSADLVTPGTLPPGTAARIDPTFPVQFSQFNNTVFIVDGTNPNLKYYLVAGTETMSTIGVKKPDAAPGVSLVAGPGLSPATGYRYRYTYLNSHNQAESEASPEGPPFDSGAPDYVFNAPIKPVNQKVQVTFAASPDPQVDKVRIYRTLDGGETYGFLAEVPDTDGSYVDAFPDWRLDDTALREFLDELPPDHIRLLVPWIQANRMLAVSATDPSTLYYSDLDLGFLKPESWPTENVIFVNRDAGDEIVGLFPFTDSVLIFCRRSIFRLRGIPPDDLTLDAVQYEDDMRTAIGGLSQKALVQVDDTLINPSLDGAYAVSRFIDTEGGFSANRLSRPIDQLWEQLSPASVQWSHGLFLRSRKQIRLWIPHSGLAVPTRCLVFQLDVSASANEPAGWTLWEIGGALTAEEFAEITASVVVETLDGDVAYIGTSSGYLGQMDEGLNDFWYEPPDPAVLQEGRRYPFVWQTVPIYLAEDERPTRFRFCDAVWGAETTATIVCTPITDFDLEWPAIVFTLELPDGFILDISKLDLDRLAPALLRREVRGSGLARAGGVFALRWRCDMDARFQIEKFRALWQPLAQKSRVVTAVQVLPVFEPAFGFGGEGTFGFGEGAFGGRP